MSGHCWRWGFWIRLGRAGPGIAVSTDAPLFSERNGYRKAVRIFGVKFEYLTKWKKT